jgi:undecaprenyl diphosphate synthase
VWHRDNGVNVIVDCMANGHERFAANVEAMRVRGVSPDDMSEELLSQELLQPAEQEADLVVVMGPPHRMPESMVWELAYSELVFLDIAWSELNSSHLELAIDDFNRRHRRFGGLDS